MLPRFAPATCDALRTALTRAGYPTTDDRGQERDHVTGVGAASLTLAAATVRRPAGSLLDLGTGRGVLAMHASRHAGWVR